MNIVQRLFSQEWSALAAAILAGYVVLSLMSPAFLTEFNLYVMLRSFCVVLVVAFAQMLTLAVGQLNLSIGALGGLVAIAVGGMMEKFGFPIALAVAIGLLIGASCGFVNGALTVRTGINGFIITLATASAFCGRQSRHHRIGPLLQSACRLRRLRHRALFRPALLIDPAPCRRGAARLISRAHRARAVFIGRRRQSLRRRAVRRSA